MILNQFGRELSLKMANFTPINLATGKTLISRMKTPATNFAFTVVALLHSALWNDINQSSGQIGCITNQPQLFDIGKGKTVTRNELNSPHIPQAAVSRKVRDPLKGSA